DFDRWRNPRTPTGIADHRLAATRQCVATGAGSVTAADVVATLRHHGDRAWGAPSGDPAAVSPPPTDVQDDWRGVTVCMHVHGVQVTNASIVTELPGDRSAPLRAWIALGSPCVSVYIPAFPPADVAPELVDPASWARVAHLRRPAPDLRPSRRAGESPRPPSRRAGRRPRRSRRSPSL